MKENNVTLNLDKCRFGVSKLSCLGHNLSAEGISPDGDELLAITQFREPGNAEEDRSFLGLVKFVGKFIPDLATVTDPLRKVMKKGELYVWGPSQAKAFKHLTNVLTNATILGYYDVNDKTHLIADASPVGLGAVLISYASKSLSDVEKRYAQTEKEALALVWAVKIPLLFIWAKLLVDN